jgi:hypothetical protein
MICHIIVLHRLTQTRATTLYLLSIMILEMRGPVRRWNHLNFYVTNIFVSKEACIKYDTKRKYSRSFININIELLLVQ